MQTWLAASTKGPLQGMQDRERGIGSDTPTQNTPDNSLQPPSHFGQSARQAYIRTYLPAFGYTHSINMSSVHVYTSTCRCQSHIPSWLHRDRQAAHRAFAMGSSTHWTWERCGEVRGESWGRQREDVRRGSTVHPEMPQNEPAYERNHQLFWGGIPQFVDIHMHTHVSVWQCSILTTIHLVGHIPTISMWSMLEFHSFRGCKQRGAWL